MYQIVAPEEIRTFIFEQLHEQRYSGHLGSDRTLEAIRCRFYWPGITGDIELWVRQCESCAKCKPGPGKGKAHLKQIKSSRPMEILGVQPYVTVIDIQSLVAAGKLGETFISGKIT